MCENYIHIRSYEPQGYLNLSKAITHHKTDEFLRHKLCNVWEQYSHEFSPVIWLRAKSTVMDSWYGYIILLKYD